MMSISDELRSSRPDVIYYFIGRDDFIPLPQAVPNSKEFLSALVAKEYHIVGAWLLGAVVGSLDMWEIESTLKCSLERIFDDCDSSNASLHLIDMCLFLTLRISANTTSRHSVLLMLCNASAQVLHISQSAVEKLLFSRVFLQTKTDFVLLEQISTRHSSVFPTLQSLYSSYSAAATPLESPQLVLPSMLSPIERAEVVSTNSIVQYPLRDSSLVDSSIETEVYNDCKAIISRFMQSEFGYSSSGERPSKDSQQGKNLQRAMDLLSKSLYTSEVHFVMELLQNADDNFYKDVQPCLKFQLRNDALYVYNNEIGFKPADIYSICRVGGSTKLDRQDTHIGQKGIGYVINKCIFSIQNHVFCRFKSVFSVSDFPEIHSNG